MTPAIRLKTKVGHDTYVLLMEQFNEHKTHGLEVLMEFKDRCIADYQKAERILGDWLDDDSPNSRMDDHHPENWEKYNVMNDICASLRYFSIRSA